MTKTSRVRTTVVEPAEGQDVMVSFRMTGFLLMRESSCGSVHKKRPNWCPGPIEKMVSSDLSVRRTHSNDVHLWTVEPLGATKVQREKNSMLASFSKQPATWKRKRNF